MSGNIKEATLYEDCLRQLLGMHAYVVFTFDKAVDKFYRSITSLKNDNFAYESWRLLKKYENSPLKFREDIYYNDFIRVIPVGGENEVYVRLGKFIFAYIFSVLFKNRNYHLSWFQFRTLH